MNMLELIILGTCLIIGFLLILFGAIKYREKKINLKYDEQIHERPSDVHLINSLRELDLGNEKSADEAYDRHVRNKIREIINVHVEENLMHEEHVTDDNIDKKYKWRK